MEWLEGVRSLLAAPSPAVLTTYRKDGSALVTPVWFRWTGEAFEVVIARAISSSSTSHVIRAARSWSSRLSAPSRGIEVRRTPVLVEGDANPVRAAIAGRYLGEADGARFAAERSTPGVVLRLEPDTPRVWDLAGILPASA